VRAAIAGLYECVLSEYIREQVREVLQRPQFSLTIDEIEAKFSHLWERAQIVTPVPFDDPQLLSVVRGDRGDLPVLATGLAMYNDPLLAGLPHKFMVSNNTTHFTPGWKPFGIHFVTGQQFWHLLQQAGKARLP